ncbi:hypothetical protein HU200_021257 [Digitaria exilis]|uniref:Uncharacterized protein n=1 Tax=Digitaria exilis TaxID=1010633 RepID=A0A835F041_9POAL|nr:hypothetical protein HU200_021257 [Digitaria exilis]CAB3472859.1 unnamed protein product [Digitaria exilis]
MATTVMMRKVSSVPAIMLLLSVLSCLLIVHGLYGLLELFGPPELSPEATLLIIFALCFLLLILAAAAVGNRRALLPRVLLPTTAEEAAVGGAAEAHHDEQVAGEEEEMRRAGLLQTEDYPGSGANSRHDPRNPH